MDENFTNKPTDFGKNPDFFKAGGEKPVSGAEKTDYSKVSSFSNYTEDRTKKVKNFSLQMADDEDYSIPEYSDDSDPYLDIISEYEGLADSGYTKQFNVPESALEQTGAVASQGKQGKKAASSAGKRVSVGKMSDERKRYADENRKRRRRARRKAKVRNSGYSVASTFLGFACCAVLILSITATLSTVALSLVDDILAYGSSSEVVRVDVPENADFQQVMDIVADAGLINQKKLCTMFAKFRHFDGRKKKDGTFKPTTYISGVYYLESNMGLEAILNTIKENPAKTADTVRLSFPEGWTVAQIFEKIEKNEVCEADKLYANLNMSAKQFKFFEGTGSDNTRYLKCEGYLYPDTYEFYIGESANSVLKKLFTNYESKWTAEYKAKAKAMGYTMDEILTVASIIQREAANKEQMAIIASIIYNRLKDSATYPQLQCDSTLNYVNKFVIPYLKDSQSYVAQIYSGAYNTYSSDGLPPGPICNPGDDAINAALNPADTDYYYFCHDADGRIYLASTYEQQRINAAKALSGGEDE